jgi:hypothetical protein
MCCIFLVAESEKLDELQELRLRFDPLAMKVPPHITVVFPFELSIPQTELEALLTAAGPMLPIGFALGEPVVMGDSLVFPTTRGTQEIVALHDRLHSGLPAQLRPAGPFLPHLTFGRDGHGRTRRTHLQHGRNLLPFQGMARRLVLGPLRERVVFVGGSAIGLLITDPMAAAIRVTKDVDVIVEVATHGGYYQNTVAMTLRI